MKKFLIFFSFFLKEIHAANNNYNTESTFFLGESIEKNDEYFKDILEVVKRESKRTLNFLRRYRNIFAAVIIILLIIKTISFFIKRRIQKAYKKNINEAFYTLNPNNKKNVFKKYKKEKRTREVGWFIFFMIILFLFSIFYPFRKKTYV